MNNIDTERFRIIRLDGTFPVRCGDDGPVTDHVGFDVIDTWSGKTAIIYATPENPEECLAKWAAHVESRPPTRIEQIAARLYNAAYPNFRWDQVRREAKNLWVRVAKAAVSCREEELKSDEVPAIVAEVSRLRNLDKTDPQQPGQLRLRIGGYYRSRSGAVIGPLDTNRTGNFEDTHPFAGKNERGTHITFRPDGRFACGEEDLGYDLLEEVGCPQQDAKETGPQLLQRLNTDAVLWAREFVKLHSGDVDLLLSWFANAIEAGRDAGRAETPNNLPGTFEWALSRLKAGAAVRLSCWPDDMCVTIRPGASPEPGPHCDVVSGCVFREPQFDVHYTGGYGPWSPQSDELLSDDWEEVVNQ